MMTSARANHTTSQNTLELTSMKHYMLFNIIFELNVYNKKIQKPFRDWVSRIKIFCLLPYVLIYYIILLLTMYL